MTTVKTNELIRSMPARPASNIGAEPVRRLSARELFAGATEVEIEHEDAVYRLKITRQGKLILNK